MRAAPLRGRGGSRTVAPVAFSWGEPVHAVVVGDFGREAAIRFCSLLAAVERERVRAELATPFFDEYRRLSLHLVCDLTYLKAGQLAPYRAADRAVDRRILAGFDGGLSVEELVPRIGALLFETLAGAMGRGARRALALAPCNTLAPACWALEERFGRPGTIVETLLEAGREVCLAERDSAVRLVEQMQVSFISVPEAVVRTAERAGAKALLPLGTSGIGEIYREAVRRSGSGIRLVLPDGPGRAAVLRTIEASVDGERCELAASRSEVLALVDRCRQRHGGDLLVVEACTDLDLGLGLDSTRAYAEAVVDAAYGEGWWPSTGKTA